MNDVFARAIEDHGYQGTYQGVFPIKVNQQRQLVEEIVAAARPYHGGLEAGSKPELLLALALMDDPNALIICNGYKDRRYVEIALTAQRLGLEAVLVIEKLSELDIIFEVADRMGVQPVLGVRAKLSNPGRGRWRASAGDRAKFGLSALAIMQMVDRLRQEGRLGCLQLLHFHIGSQVTAIQTFKKAMREATRLYVELTRLGAPMRLLDVGGGIAVDYDGSRTTFDSSRNYTESEYAADIVAHVGEACSSAEVAHPTLVTEAGRATAAHCAILLFDVLGVEQMPTSGPPAPERPDEHELVGELRSAYEAANARSYQEAWHDAQDVRLRSRHAFELGVLGLDELAQIDALFWKICGRIQHVAREQSYVPDELGALTTLLADTYYGNFSVFQSVPDAWAVDQLFPCLPIQRLHEEPTRRGVIADLTCDSDGKLTRFVDRRDVKKVLELHPLRVGERYVLAVALVGAYQEILGDLHNLFGDTHAVHVRVDESGAPVIDRVIDGDSVQDVAGYVQYDRKELIHRVRNATERGIRAGALRQQDAAKILACYRESLDGYTYLGH
jgi:arginine decarboxylase